MAYLALYRVWRPQTFADLVGQKHVTTTLQNALRERRFSHAYLFCGPRGTGKTSAAKIMAKAVNCERGPAAEPCNECAACTGITKGAVVDVVEIDAASNRGVEEIRDIRDKVKYAPTEVRYKVYIIDEVHMLTTEAFNALLKTLEEPPEHVIFILATTEPHRLPPTIISRCQRFDFRRIPPKEIVERLKQICQVNGMEAEERALALIARVAEGGMRDALSLLDQAFSFAKEKVTVDDVVTITGAVSHTYLAQIAECVLQKDAAALLDLVDRLMGEGKDPLRLMEDLIHYYRDLLLYQAAPRLWGEMESGITDEAFCQLAQQHRQQQLFSFIQVLNQAQGEMKWASHPRVLLEVALLKLCHGEEREKEEGAVPVHAPSDRGDALSLASLLDRIQRLEEQVKRLQEQPPAASTPSARQERKKEARQSVVPPTFKVDAHQFHEILARASERALTTMRAKWPEILHAIKERKIQVHAWFIDGNPVAATEDAVVVAFKSPIHRETTEKPNHREIIEDVLRTVAGKPVRLLTLMENQWREIAESFNGASAGAEVTEGQDPLIEEAIKLAGESLLEIKD
ncbi:DNA polymerase III subunit gamma/tau [Bacillaceae bacterium]